MKGGTGEEITDRGRTTCKLIRVKKGKRSVVGERFGIKHRRKMGTG